MHNLSKFWGQHMPECAYRHILDCGPILFSRMNLYRIFTWLTGVRYITLKKYGKKNKQIDSINFDGE